MTRKVLFSVFLMSCVVQLCAQNITVISAAGETPNAFVNTDRCVQEQWFP